MDEAVKQLAGMDSIGLRPAVVTYTTLLNGYYNIRMLFAKKKEWKVQDKCAARIYFVTKPSSTA